MKIKINATPPFIVFFDVLMVFMFFLALSQTNGGGVAFRLPSERLFAGARLVYNEGGIYRYADTQESLSQENPILFAEPCGHQKECVLARKGLEGRQLSIVFPAELTAELGVLVTLATRAGCKGFNATIAESGYVDRKLTYAQNVCLQKVPAIDTWLQGVDKLR